MAEGRTEHINQGEYAVGADPEHMITTLLGSCVAVCLHDPRNHVGGMNHILLPEETGGAATGASFGVNAMELLINGVIKLGADRRHLEAKVFGGGRMVAGLSDIGKRNREFVMRFLEAEHIACIGESTGGNSGRRIQFWPHSGKARQKFMEAAFTELPAAPPKPKAEEVELF
ncbi:chemotaxis protein CheD [Mangrovicoccus algicola]|uniref:Probable chemoreceptor glutamine deamidase CheD n=1 Tax=Mangrovicoccus algicola TaxID=2771008 RepID=A0A8J6Z415_9RHOB|nr:chemotaxis protein CheD [Mangrovicoccus algicola]MBE3637119.1 chemotaxis protein CheD [Mangrovicoccus algicola]